MRRAIVLALVALPLPSLAAPRTLTLEQAVDLALSLDPTLAAARVAGDRSKLAVLRAQLDRVSVKVDGQLRELWNKTNIGGAAVNLCTVNGVSGSLDPATCASLGGTSSTLPDSGGQGLFNMSASVTVPVFSGLRVESNVARTQRLEDAASLSIRQVRRDTALAVARAYWAVRRLSVVRDAQQRGLDRLRDAEAVATARVQAGLAPPIDQNRARLRRLQQTATYQDLAGQVKEAGVQLAVALGLSEDVELVDPVDPPDRAPPPVAELLSTGQKGRAEPSRARLQLEAQRFAVRAAKSTYYPQLNAFGIFQLGNNSLNFGTGASGASSSANPFSNVTGNLTLGLQLSMNFFDTLNTWTAVKDARYEEARLVEEQRRVSRLVESDVRAAQAKVDHLHAQRLPLVEASAVARDNLTILQARYQNGDALVIELLEGALDLGNAELAVADVTAQLKMAWIELDAALGSTVGVDK